jgi:hypothetical protein
VSAGGLLVSAFSSAARSSDDPAEHEADGLQCHHDAPAGATEPGIDYFLLLKMDGKWGIANKVNARRYEAPDVGTIDDS